MGTSAASEPLDFFIIVFELELLLLELLFTFNISENH